MNIDIKFDSTGKIISFYEGKEITMENSPYIIFLATVGMCSAVYIRDFVNQRNLTLDEITISERINYNESIKMVDEIELFVYLPDSFPKKYKNAIKAVVDQCTVKKHLAKPPAVSVSTSLELIVNK